MERRCFLKKAGICAAACLAGPGILKSEVSAGPAQPRTAKGLAGVVESPYYTSLQDKAVQCSLCPKECVVEAGGRGWCGVRENREGKYYSLVYGNPCALNADPIEKKPFFHVMPGTTSFSIATAGCNFDCKFCQNWEISQADPDETVNYELPPDQVAAWAERFGCRSIASTYVEPTIFMEYMQAVGRAAREKGLRKVMHSNGFVNTGPLKDLCAWLDAACIDLKGFSDEYYSSMSQGSLQPVLNSLKLMRREGVHIELVTLLVPGRNDDMQQIQDMCKWVRDELGPDTPHHFSRFYPQYKLKSLPPTPPATMDKARETALKAGLEYVYLGNLPGHEAENTFCPKCNELLIARKGYSTKVKALSNGKCSKCGKEVTGIWK